MKNYLGYLCARTYQVIPDKLHIGPYSELGVPTESQIHRRLIFLQTDYSHRHLIFRLDLLAGAKLAYSGPYGRGSRGVCNPSFPNLRGVCNPSFPNFKAPLRLPKAPLRLPKVPEGSRRFPKVPEGSLRFPKVPEGSRGFKLG